jgi:hypothetical protein
MEGDEENNEEQRNGDKRVGRRKLYRNSKL